MTTSNTHRAIEALDADNDAIADYAASILDSGAVVYDADGDPAGVTYYDAGTHGWYAADMHDVRALLERVGSGEHDAYSLWCADTTATEHESREDAAAEVR